MSFGDLNTADMRLVILCVLMEGSGYSHNEHVLRKGLDLYGHKISGDKLRTELSWLDEQGLVVVDASAGVQVAKLTGRGADVAKGRTIVPGVQRPEPGLIP